MQASIVVSNYNYGRFLRQAIDSALGQTYRPTEVIVVDDGSTDDSRTIIASYGNSIVPVLKENGGLASALNAGFVVSRGSVVVFLDSDDFLEPTALDRAVELFADPTVVKAHWPLLVTDISGRRTRRMVKPDPSDGDMLESVLRDGPANYCWPPTSGNAWARSFLNAVLPIPEAVTNCPDLYLAALAPLFGSMRRVREPQGFYRKHGSSMSGNPPVEQRIHDGVRAMEYCMDVFGEHCRRRQIPITTDRWRSNSWFHNMQCAILNITATIPPGTTVILVDDGYWGTHEIDGRRCISFAFYGRRDDLAGAVAELRQLRQQGATFIAFVWPKLWWLEHFSLFASYLRRTTRCALESDHVVIFELGPAAACR